ncbi:MAG: acyl-CoA dehydrogenase domain-containing protein [Candidatus Paceibacterota bacterium]
MGLAFPHGPIEATDMFIPLAWIIGERTGVGLGWKMIMQCLFMGRALALPSISVGSIKLALLTTSAYARVRRQFGLSIDTYEGIKESLAELVELTYVSEAARSLTAALVDSGSRPLAVSSLMKYRITENARSAINHALDVHAGKGACDGPANYLLSAYNAVPIGVTVEGANIVSRSVITFAQGVLQSHPFVRPALESCESKNYKQDLDDFDSAISGHIQLLQANAARSFLHAISGGVFASCPRDVPKDIRNWYRALSRYTSSFAYLSDVTVITMGHELKKKQKLGGRLADVLAELYILSAVLKQYEEDGFPAEDYPIIEQSLTNGLYRIEKNLLAVIRNFPQRLLRPLLFSIVFPVGAWRQPAKDALTTTVADSVSEATPTRARLTRHVFISDSSNDSVRQLENAFVAANHAASVYKKIRAATRAGLLKKDHTQLQVAESKGIITSEEAHLLQEAEKTAKVAIAVDTFEQDVYRPA